MRGGIFIIYVVCALLIMIFSLIIEFIFVRGKFYIKILAYSNILCFNSQSFLQFQMFICSSVWNVQREIWLFQFLFDILCCILKKLTSFLFSLHNPKITLYQRALWHMTSDYLSFSPNMILIINIYSINQFHLVYAMEKSKTILNAKLSYIWVHSNIN